MPWNVGDSYKTAMPTADILNRRLFGVGGVLLAIFLAAVLTWNFWFLEKPFVQDSDDGK